MNKRRLPVFNAYVPGRSFLHRLPGLVKICLLLFYLITIFTSWQPVIILGFVLALTSVTLLLFLPLRGYILLFATLFLLLSNVLWPAENVILVWLGLISGKITCLFLLTRLFIMTTKPNEFLETGLGESGRWRKAAQPAVYILNTTIAILPSVQHDLQKAIDAEIMRRGHRMKLYSLSSWLAVLTTLIVRGLLRAQRVTETVIDRGFNLATGMTSLQERQMKRVDAILLILTIIPAFLVMIFR